MCVPVGVRIQILFCCIYLIGARLEASDLLAPSHQISQLLTSETPPQRLNMPRATSPHHFSFTVFLRMVQVNYSSKKRDQQVPSAPNF